MDNVRTDYRYSEGKLMIEVHKEWDEIKIKDIKFEGVLGEGANGVVLRGIDEKLARKVAIKIWLPNKKSKKNEVSYSQYLEEVRKIANLNNSNIISLYRADSISEVIHYSIMELVEGITLKKIIRERRWYLSEKGSNIAKKIINTMIECYKKEIYHGDLHLGNIMIDQNDNVKILDFGTSLFVRDKNHYSQERECKLLVDTICRILECKDINTYTSLYVPKSSEELYELNDIRHLEPIQIAKVLLGITNIIEYINKNEYDEEELFDTLCHTPCINIERVIEKIGQKHQYTETQKSKIWNDLFEYMLEEFWNEEIESDENKYLVAYIQWEIIKMLIKERSRNDWELEDTIMESKIFSNRFKESFTQPKCISLIKALNSEMTFFEFINRIQTSLEEDFFSVIDNIGLIIECLVEKEIHQILYLQIALTIKQETLENEELLGKIIQLARVTQKKEREK